MPNCKHKYTEETWGHWFLDRTTDFHITTIEVCGVCGEEKVMDVRNMDDLINYLKRANKKGH